MADEKENNMVSNNSDNTATHSSFQQDLTYILLGDEHNKVYRIPDYQRGYSWEEDQVRDLWEDILSLFYGSKNQKHYTGMIVLDPISTEDKQYVLHIEGKNYKNQTNGYYVVDGQQRLTTLIIFLWYIVKKANSYLPESEWDNTDYFRYSPDGVPKKTYRFGYCSKEIDDYFQKRVFGEKKPEIKNVYEKNINFACDYIEKALYRFDEKTIMELKSILLDRILFNIYGISRDFDVRTTFETMNNRGKSLSTLEKLKNRLMYLATKFDDEGLTLQLIGDIDTSWNTIYYNLAISNNTSLNDDEFLRAHWFLYHGATKTHGDSYVKEILDDEFSINKFVEKIRKSDNLGLRGKDNKAYKDVDLYITSLASCSEKWAYVKDQNSSVKESVENNLDSDTKKMISRLSHIQHKGGEKYLHPLLMGSLYKNPDHSDYRLEFYKSLESFIFINSFVVYSTKNDLSSFIKDMYPLIHDEGPDGEVADSVFNNLVKSLNAHQYSPQNLLGKDNVKSTKNDISSKFFKKFFDDDQQGFYNWEGRVYFLFEYDSHLTEFKKKSNYFANINEVSIEHIFPQNPSDARFKSAGNYWERAFAGFLESEDDAAANLRNRKITHMLGNLVLLFNSQENSTISNHSFPFKSKSSCINDLKDVNFPKTEFTYRESTTSAAEVAENYGQVDKLKGHFLPEDVIARTKTLLDYLYDRWIGTAKDCALSKDEWIELYRPYTDEIETFLKDPEANGIPKRDESLKEELDNFVMAEIEEYGKNKDASLTVERSCRRYDVEENLKKYYLTNEFDVCYAKITTNQKDDNYYKQDCFMIVVKTPKEKKNQDVNGPYIESIKLFILDNGMKIKYDWKYNSETNSYNLSTDDGTEEYVNHLDLNSKIRGFINVFKNFGAREQVHWKQ